MPCPMLSLYALLCVYISQGVLLINLLQFLNGRQITPGQGSKLRTGFRIIMGKPNFVNLPTPTHPVQASTMSSVSITRKKRGNSVIVQEPNRR